MNKLTESKRKQAKSIIYKTAIDLFRTTGYENTSIQTICSACEIAKGTFYNYFNSKEDIIRESFRNGIDEYLSNEMQTIDISNKPMEALEKFIIISLDYCNIVGQKTTALAYICNLNSTIHDNENMLYDGHYGVLKQIYHAGIRNNSWKSKPTENDFIHLVSAFVNGLMINFCFSTQHYDIAARNYNLVTHFITTI